MSATPLLEALNVFWGAVFNNNKRTLLPVPKKTI